MTSHALQGPVLIAGAGIGGLMAALSLAQTGCTVCIFERAEAPGEVGAGIQLGPNATRILDRHDLLPALRSALVHPERLRIMDGTTGRLVAQMPLGERFRQRFGAPYTVVHRRDLQQALVAACSAHERISIRFDWPLKRYELSEDGVTAFARDGREAAGAILVGADGIRSAVRRQMLRDGEPDYSGHTAYRTLIEAGSAPADADASSATLWQLPGAHLVHYPVSGGARHNVVAICEDAWCEPGWTVASSAEAALQRFYGACPAVRRILEAGSDYTKWALADRPPAGRWVDGRVALLGDAAHPVLPYLAQGAAMAIEDADAIAACLSGSGGNPSAGLDTYQALRQARTERLYHASHRQGDIYHAGGFTRFARNRIMPFLTADQWYKRLAWIYDGD